MHRAPELLIQRGELLGECQVQHGRALHAALCLLLHRAQLVVRLLQRIYRAAHRWIGFIHTHSHTPCAPLQEEDGGQGVHQWLRYAHGKHTEIIWKQRR